MSKNIANKLRIIEFSIQNYKIFGEKVTFSMTSRKHENHTFESNGENLLKASFIFGPNASGKSSLLGALDNIKGAILLSANNPENTELPYRPNLSVQSNKKEPTFFELVFSLEGGDHNGIYIYNFSYFANYFETENLARIVGDEEINLFSRRKQEITINKKSKELKDARILLNRTRREALFLSVLYQFNIPLAVEVHDALNNINVISGIVSGRYRDFSVKEFEKPAFREKYLKYIKAADFCIDGGESREVDVHTINLKNNESGKFSASQRIEKQKNLFLKHKVYNGDKVVDDFELSLDDESTGTKKFLIMLGPVIDTLESGRVLFIDEFDNSLHPLLTKFIIDLFESPDTNKNNAQLIVTTHDTSILRYKDDFIKAQFWFTEKDKYGCAKLFSLGEFELRNDTEYAKKYLEGRFGALPFIDFPD